MGTTPVTWSFTAFAPQPRAASRDAVRLIVERESLSPGTPELPGDVLVQRARVDSGDVGAVGQRGESVVASTV
jgi:hypothetical protein